MNIEEIRSRIEKSNPSKLTHSGDGDIREDSTADWVAEFKKSEDAELFLHARTDITYLLSIIETAEKALEDCKTSHIAARCNWCNNDITEIADRALQVIRGR